MNIYAFIPLIATLAYIPLLASTIVARPWRKKHVLFLLFLIAASLWSLVDVIFRNNYFPEQSKLLVHIIVFLFIWMAVQFHVFTSSFFPPNKGRWLPYAYGVLVAFTIPNILGYIPREVIIEGDKLYPQYGYVAYLMAAALLVLLARNLYIFIPRLKTQDNPNIYNQTVSLLLCLGILTFFMLLAIVPMGREFPLGHIGNLFIALILSYAVIGQQLVDIRSVLRRGTVWVTLLFIGILTFWLLIFLLHFIIKFNLSIISLMVVTLSATISAISVYKLHPFLYRFINRAIQGESFKHREQLVEFANKIQNVFSLKEQGAELLTLIIQAVGCHKAGLLFVDSSGNYDSQNVETANKEKTISDFKLRGDNPIVEYLKRERRPLTRESISVQPEFLGLWQQEKDLIERNNIELFIPLISRNRLIGILVMDAKKSGRYNLEEYNILEDVINRVAVSLEKEYISEQLKEREEELSVINRSNAIITSSLDIQRIYNHFIRELKRVVDVDWAAIAVIEDMEVYFMAISTDIGSPWKVGERLSLKGSGTEWVAMHAKPTVDNNLEVEARFTSAQYHLQHGIRSIAFLPLTISNQVIGSLIVASRKPNAYNARQINLLQQLSNQIAMPIENARLYAKTERMARVDGLTGLLNRRSLDETLNGEIGRHSRYGGVFSFILVDLDSLKNINDNYGHLAGDELLRQIGQIIQHTIRESDRAFRYGGDEYAIVLPQTPIEAAFKVAERIRQQTFAKIEIGSMPISLSLGLSSWPSDGITPAELMAAADAALYKAKRSGRNRSVCSTSNLNQAHKDTVNIRIAESTESGALSTIYALAATVDNRDRQTQNHSKKVHDYAVAMGERIGMNQLEINRLGTCALLHDIGKIGISDELLQKKEPLTPEEWETVKSHSRMGAAIVGHTSQLAPCVQGILHHHERFDGSGYPDGLKGTQIPLESRILGIVDSYVTMISARVYAPALSREAAIEEIKKGAGTQFDPELVKVFLEIATKAPELAERP